MLTATVLKTIKVTSCKQKKREIWYYLHRKIWVRIAYGQTFFNVQIYQCTIVIIVMIMASQIMRKRRFDYKY